MRIALPTLDGRFCEHFGRCTSLFVCDVDDATGQLGRTRSLIRARKPSHCETLPDWCAELGVTHMLAGGMGVVAQHRFEALGIAVSVGHGVGDPLAVVADFLRGAAAARDNPCETFEHRHHHCRTKKDPDAPGR